MKKSILLTVLAVIAALVILVFPETAATASKNALQRCLTDVIPSLMTFMTLSCFVSYTAVGDVLARLFSPFMRRVFHLPAVCTRVVLLSFLGGYPCGAKLIADLLFKNEISLQTAQYLLRFCINPSPAYVITAVGVGLFQNPALGLTLYITHTAAALLLAFLTRPQSPISPSPVRSKTLPVGTALVKAVCDSTNAMVTVSGFVITVSTGIALCERLGILSRIGESGYALFCCFMDVVSGAAACGNCPPFTAVLLAAGAVSLGGASVWLQVYSFLNDRRIRFFSFVFWRICHALLTAGAVWFIMKISDFSLPTVSQHIYTLSNRPMTVALFLLCSVFFLLTVGASKRGERHEI